MAGALVADCRDESLNIRGDWGQARFQVEIAADDSTRALGLMHREAMSAGAGMLFVYPEAQMVTFWMKNTLIPLDMLFIDARGLVVHMHHQAMPGDRSPIPSRVPVQFVLEINGGFAADMDISIGSEIQHPRIFQKDAFWPCER